MTSKFELTEEFNTDFDRPILAPPIRAWNLRAIELEIYTIGRDRL